MKEGSNNNINNSSSSNSVECQINQTLSDLQYLTNILTSHIYKLHVLLNISLNKESFEPVIRDESILDFSIKNILNFNFKTNKHGLISDLCVRLQYISDSLCNSDSATASAYELSYDHQS